MANNCIYFVEGPCEEQLIKALKEFPPLLASGKVKIFNVVQNLIPKSTLFTFTEGTTVILVFDTDVSKSSVLLRNINTLKKYCSKVKIVFFPQVLTLEDELERSTDVRKVTELTKSKSTKDFKSDFCKLKPKECRNMLNKHKLNIHLLWETLAPKPFSFIQNNGKEIKIFP